MRLVAQILVVVKLPPPYFYQEAEAGGPLMIHCGVDLEVNMETGAMD